MSDISMPLKKTSFSSQASS